MAGMTRSWSYSYEEQSYQVTLRAIAGDQKSWWIQINSQPAEKFTCVLRREAFVLLRRGNEQVQAYVEQGEIFTQVQIAGRSYQLRRRQAPDLTGSAQGGTGQPTQKTLKAPMAGTIVKIQVQTGEAVTANQVLVILSAMKMEHAITAPYAGKVQRILYREGEAVPGGTTIVEMEPEE
jgi:biotin carboxyl carrier protein